MAWVRGCGRARPIGDYIAALRGRNWCLGLAPHHTPPCPAPAQSVKACGRPAHIPSCYSCGPAPCSCRKVLELAHEKLRPGGSLLVGLDDNAPLQLAAQATAAR